MKVAFLFPGYGSQYVGMGKELYDEYRIVQEYFEEASQCLNINFVKLCFASSDAEIGRIENAYPAIFLVSSALVGLLRQEGIEPHVVAGYNQGEYAALYAAGSISFPDGLYLLSKQASFYQEAIKESDFAAMSVHGVPTQHLQDMCLQASTLDHKVFIAIYQATLDHIVTGDLPAIKKLRDMVDELSSATTKPESIDGGLHSPLLKDMAKQFKMYLEKVDFKDLKTSLICGLDGSVTTHGQLVRDEIVEHIHSPIVWTRILNALEDYDVIVEIGPGASLSSLVAVRYPHKQVLSVNKKSDIQSLIDILKPQRS